jgi:hypothetical protein
MTISKFVSYGLSKARSLLHAAFMKPYRAVSYVTNANLVLAVLFNSSRMPSATASIFLNHNPFIFV